MLGVDETVMKSAALTFEDGFRVAIGNARSQGAVMVIAPGAREGGPDNRHGGADQWLYVVDGMGEATVAGQMLALKPGSLVLIEAGDCHEIRNTGRIPLKTVTIYLPPAYDQDGDELPPGKP
jgi:mannose-6-phosphate isomerase-like protein (cupin superfamily)